MPLVSAKCTSCGANLEVDNTKDAAICPYCNTPYIVEKAINNYNISAAVVNIYGDNQPDFVNRGGVLVEYRGSKTEICIPEGEFVEVGYQTKGEDIVGAFEGRNRITKVVIPEGVTAIGDQAFSECSSLSEVVLPSTLEEIGTRAFEKCESLKTIVLPKSLKKIGPEAFLCSGLAYLTIDESVTEIGHGAFSHCLKLTDIVLPGNISRIAWETFKFCESLQRITIPNGVTSIGDGAFCGCTKITEVIIPQGVKSISQYTFYDCKKLTNVVIPEGVTTIWDSAFQSCSALTKIVLPTTLRKIGGHAFGNCSNLSEVIMPKNVVIGDCAFALTPYRDKQGCYIATCVYGSYDCPQVWTLRRFRDNTLAQTLIGRMLIKTYYAVSPTIVKWFGKTNWFKKMCKKPLNRLVAELQKSGIKDTPYNDKPW